MIITNEEIFGRAKRIANTDKFVSEQHERLEHGPYSCKYDDRSEVGYRNT